MTINTEPLAELSKHPISIMRVAIGTVLGFIVLVGGSILFAAVGLISVWIYIWVTMSVVIGFIALALQSSTRRAAISSFAAANKMKQVSPDAVLQIMPKHMKSRVFRNNITNSYTVDYGGYPIVIFDFLPESFQKAWFFRRRGVVAVRIRKMPSLTTIKRILDDPTRPYRIEITDNTIFISTNPSFYVKSNIDNLLERLKILFAELDKESPADKNPIRFNEIAIQPTKKYRNGIPAIVAAMLAVLLGMAVSFIIN